MDGTGAWRDNRGDVGWRVSIAGVDPDTPVVGIGDRRRYERLVILMGDDDDRFALAAVIRRERDHEDRRSWWDSTIGRGAAILGIVAVLADVVARILTVASGGHP